MYTDSPVFFFLSFFRPCEFATLAFQNFIFCMEPEMSRPSLHRPHVLSFGKFQIKTLSSKAKTQQGQVLRCQFTLSSITENLVNFHRWIVFFTIIKLISAGETTSLSQRRHCGVWLCLFTWHLAIVSVIDVLLWFESHHYNDFQKSRRLDRLVATANVK